MIGLPAKRGRSLVDDPEIFQLVHSPKACSFLALLPDANSWLFLVCLEITSYFTFQRPTHGDT